MMKRDLPGYVVGEDSETFTAAALQAADKYTPMIPTIISDRAAGAMVCSVVVSGLVGGDAGSIIQVRAYGFWGSGDTVTSGLYRTSMGIWRGDSVGGAAGQAYAIAANAAGSFVFAVGLTDSEAAGAQPPVFPYIAIRLDKEGTGSFTAGSVVVNWKFYMR